MLSSMLFVGVIFLFYFIEFHWNRRRFYKLAKNLPGHDGLTVLESIKLAFKATRKDYIKIIENFIKSDSPVTKIWLANYFVLLTKDPEFIHKIFNNPSTYDKPSVFYQVFFMDLALTPLGGDVHRKHRRILNKAFTAKVLQELPNVFDEKSKKILKLMEEKLENGEFDVAEYIGALALENFGKINLNFEIEYYGSEIHKVVNR